MTHQAGTIFTCGLAKDQPKELNLYEQEAHINAYDTTHIHSLPTLGPAITLPLRIREHLKPSLYVTKHSEAEAENASLGLESQLGPCDEHSTMSDDPASPSDTEGRFQFRVPDRGVALGNGSPFNHPYQAPNCNPYSPESLHRIGMKLMVTVPYESVYGPAVNLNAPKYVEVPLETITNDGRKRSLQIDGSVYLPPSSGYEAVPPPKRTTGNYNPYAQSQWSPTQPVYLARKDCKDKS